MSEANIVSAIIGVNTILLTIVGFFFSRLIASLDAVTKRMHEIELVQTRMQTEMQLFAERLVQLVRVVGLPERVERIEKDLEEHDGYISTLRDRQHDLADALNGIIHAAEITTKPMPVKLKEWPK